MINTNINLKASEIRQKRYYLEKGAFKIVNSFILERNFQNKDLSGLKNSCFREHHSPDASETYTDNKRFM